MEQYTSMAQSIDHIKRPLIYIALLGSLIHILILGAGIFLGQQKNNDKYSVLQICHIGMNDFFNNNPSTELFDKSVLEAVKGHKFKIEKIKLIKQRSSFNCDVVAQDSKGYRSFLVSLQKNSSFTHLYKISDVKEQKIISTYQWKDNI